MEIIKDTTEFKINEQTAVAIGKFDGLHLGHKALISELLKAGKKGLKTAVFTFDPSPGIYFSMLRGSVTYRELMTRDEKRESFETLGIDYLVEYPFRAETAAVTAQEYVKRYLLDQMNAKLIVAGEDVSFGRGGAGDAELLKKIVRKSGSECHRGRALSDLCNEGSDLFPEVLIIPKIEKGGMVISSTLVRKMVEEGNMEETSGLLGEDYCIRGKVMHGNHIGRSLGMPTANLYPPDRKLLPPKGVFFSSVTIKSDGSTTYRSITNIGCRPTVHGDDPKVNVETHILDFDKDIYGEDIEVRLLHFHRREKRFGTLEELKEQMNADVMARDGYDL